MKILQLGKFYPLKGGVEKVMYAIAEGLSEHGIDCDALFASGDGQTEPIRLNDHCQVFRCNTLCEAKATKIAPSMVSMLKKMAKNYDVIHVHHPDPMAALALYLARYKGKVVLHWHCDIIRQNKLLMLYRPLQSWLIRRADVIVGTSPVYLKQSEALKEVQSKCHTIPIGVYEMPIDKSLSAEIQKRYKGKRIVFSLGRLVLYKGYEHLIEAAKYLSDDYVVVIGGSGYQHGHLQEVIDTLGLQEKVKLIGFIPDEEVGAYFDACKVFCLSSIDKREAFAIVQAKAMFCSRPIVSTDIPGSGVPWVNKHGVSGLNVKPCDSKALAEAIMEVCSDENRYQQYCQESRQRYEELFRMDCMISSCQSLYESFFARRSTVTTQQPSSVDQRPSFVRIRTHLKLRKVGSQFFVVNPGSENIDLTDIYTLNQEAAFLWESFVGRDFDAETMAECLYNKYDVSPEQALDDVTEMLNLWEEYGILERIRLT